MITVPDWVRRAPFERGGRGPEGIDCYGVVQVLSALRGNPLGDVWKTFRERWLAGESVDVAHGVPCGWNRVEPDEAMRAPQDGDVWVLRGARPGVGIILHGRLSTSQPRSGYVCLDPSTVGPAAEVWRP